MSVKEQESVRDPVKVIEQEEGKGEKGSQVDCLACEDVSSCD